MLNSILILEAQDEGLEVLENTISGYEAALAETKKAIGQKGHNTHEEGPRSKYKTAYNGSFSYMLDRSFFAYFVAPIIPITLMGLGIMPVSVGVTALICLLLLSYKGQFDTAALGKEKDLKVTVHTLTSNLLTMSILVMGISLSEVLAPMIMIALSALLIANHFLKEYEEKKAKEAEEAKKSNDPYTAAAAAGKYLLAFASLGILALSVCFVVKTGSVFALGVMGINKLLSSASSIGENVGGAFAIAALTVGMGTVAVGYFFSMLIAESMGRHEAAVEDGGYHLAKLEKGREDNNSLVNFFLPV